MATMTVDGDVRLHYRLAGTGPAVVFHPGFANTLDIWNWVVRELVPDRTCVTFDPRGHGASDKPDSTYTLDELAADTGALLAHLDLADVTLVGHSLGGAVAFQTALKHDDGRIARLALLSPAIPTFVAAGDLGIGVPREEFSAMRQGLGAGMASMVLGMAEFFFHRTDDATARWLLEKCLEMPVHLAERYFAQLGTIDFRPVLADVGVPVLTAWGEHDRMADLRWVEWLRAANLPGWSVETLAHSGHGMMVDEPEALAALLRDFGGSRS
ncbi:alpha/beta fold hydrolase [Amycolatopsis sp. EV170708-02-1]|uniref:alpha/beta fold hydrolase n=1 Tax=Amycolatopsis sp. EV170708-02-1 TaxID=2919322 RepID=UPI001F0C458A|nr:alpha/beta fold hydrolase [Amycolatopsis sp. EV170708-02-1]UMP03423.1 alpha/beta fold hydrolase [Amycolatopsis sp. EV170708-02-1]